MVDECISAIGTDSNNDKTDENNGNNENFMCGVVEGIID